MRKNRYIIIFASVIIALSIIIALWGLSGSSMLTFTDKKEGTLMAATYQIGHLFEEKEYEEIEYILDEAQRRVGSEHYLLSAYRGDLYTVRKEFEKAEKVYSKALQLIQDVSKDKRSRGVEILMLRRKLSAVQEGRAWTSEEVFSSDITKEEKGLLKAE